MKRIILLYIAAFVTATANCQTFTNGGMEVWDSYSSGLTSFTSVALQRPDGWFGSDSLAVYFAQLIDFSSGKLGATYSQQLTKTTDSYSGTYAAKLETLKQGDSLVLPCIMANAKMNVNTAALADSDLTEAFSFSGGTPVTERITDVMAFVKYSVNELFDTSGSDSGLILVEAMRHDTLVGAGQMSVGPLTVYTPKDVTISYMDATSIPDTIVVAFFSSGAHYAQGSTLFVDDVTMGTLGVGNVSSQPLARVYPNPSNGLFTVSVPNGVKLTMNVVDMDGRLIVRKTIGANTTINLTSMPEGSYFYTMEDGNGLITSRGKLAIMR